MRRGDFATGKLLSDGAVERGEVSAEDVAQVFTGELSHSFRPREADTVPAPRGLQVSPHRRTDLDSVLARKAPELSEALKRAGASDDQLAALGAVPLHLVCTLRAHNGGLVINSYRRAGCL